MIKNLKILVSKGLFPLALRDRRFNRSYSEILFCYPLYDEDIFLKKGFQSIKFISLKPVLENRA